MKKLLLGSVALVALGAGAPAIAADFGVAPRAVHYVAGTNWTGCHIGGMVGDEWGTTNGWSTTSATTFGVGGRPTPFLNTPIAPNYNMTGFTGGGYAGCDYQFGAWVVGVEGDWSSMNKAGQAFDISPPFTATFVKQSTEHWLATARGRLGYAVDKWLLYVTGGGAWARIDTATWNIVNPLQTGVTDSNRVTGWTVGAGIEYDLRWGWSARTEYLYVQLPSFTTFTPGSGTGVVPGTTLNNLNVGRTTNNILRVGLTYKFGDWGRAAPVVTK
jgi:outer membrane immunogenic protein